MPDIKEGGDFDFACQMLNDGINIRQNFRRVILYAELNRKFIPPVQQTLNQQINFGENDVLPVAPKTCRRQKFYLDATKNLRVVTHKTIYNFFICFSAYRFREKISC